MSAWCRGEEHFQQQLPALPQLLNCVPMRPGAAVDKRLMLQSSVYEAAGLSPGCVRNGVQDEKFTRKTIEQIHSL